MLAKQLQPIRAVVSSNSYIRLPGGDPPGIWFGLRGHSPLRLRQKTSRVSLRQSGREGILKECDKPSEALERFVTELYAAFGAPRSFGRR
jgi:hypothetical protein